MKPGMAPALRKSSFAQLLEDRLSQLSSEADTLFAESREHARREFADQLNQAVRRLRIASEPGELGATLLDAAAQFSTGAAIFHIAGDRAKPERIRGVPESVAQAIAALEIPLATAAALHSAVESRDPVTAVTTPGEVSAVLFKLLEHTGTGRVSLYPVVVRDRVPALLYVWGSVQGSAIELLTEVAAALWSAMPEPIAATGLVTIAPAPEAARIAAPEAEPASIASL